MIAINHNLMASNTANSLNGHYGRLQTSTQRLSSGLRINSAADDAAGLAIRELMRADIAALNQGTRNANDAISMLQTFDGALSIIDEKLIRMKELAEQAATGTYDSTQRLMIDSEFQAMASEIDRIANATDFNGVKLLCTKLISWTTDEDRFVITNPGTVSTPVISRGNAATVSKNINAGKLINEANPAKTINVTLTAENGKKTDEGPLVLTSGGPDSKRKEYDLQGSEFKMAYLEISDGVSNPVVTYGNNAWSMKDDNNTYVVVSNPNNQAEIGGMAFPVGPSLSFGMSDINGEVDLSQFNAAYPKITGLTVDTKEGKYYIERDIVTIDPTTNNTADYTVAYNDVNQIATVTLANGGGSVTLKLDNPLANGDTINFDIDMAGEVQTVPVEHFGVDPNQKVKIHFGPGNDSAEDYYYIQFQNCTREGLGIGDLDIKTQENAQNALVQIDDAIVAKDKIRADYGALQNRFENTVTNLRIQSENLQAAESRISDTDIAIEMTMFVRNQILTQSAVAMLAQANSMPQLVMKLVS